jgi:MFS family permease
VGYFSDRAASRRGHYLFGLFALTLATLLVGVARNYWLLVFARLLQGCSSAVVWTIGMAVLADTLPTEQLGIAMGTIGSIVSFAMVAAPFLGGTIFERFGYESVFYFLGAMLLIDIILRLLMIERGDAKKWGIGIESDNRGEESQALLDGGGTDATPRKSLLSLLTVIILYFQLILVSAILDRSMDCPDILVHLRWSI